MKPNQISQLIVLEIKWLDNQSFLRRLLKMCPGIICDI